MTQPSDASHLPLTPLTFGILTALARGPLNGYRIVQGVEEASQGTLSPGTGTVYVALQRLMTSGLLEPAPEPDGVPSDKRARRWYALTPLGRRVLTLEARRLSGALRLAVEAGVLDEEG